MRINLKTFYFFLLSLLLVGCIKVELKDEREISGYFEIALVTHTPSGLETVPPTATATVTPSLTPTDTPTNTPQPSLTPVTSTPELLAVINSDSTCRQGPGESYPGSSYLTVGEVVIVVGRNPEATWWLVQKEDGTQICWASKDVLTLSGDTLSVAIMSTLPTPTRAIFAQPMVSPTQKSRPKPPRATSVVPPSATDTPAPYPYPAP